MTIRQLSLSLIAIASVSTTPALADRPGELRVGNYHAGEVNGISFIQGDDAAFLARVGWVQDGKYLTSYNDFAAVVTRFETCAPDGSFCRSQWKPGASTITLDWGRSGKSGVIGRVTSTGPARIALETAPTWKTFTTAYSVNGSVITGTSQVAGKPSITWSLKADRDPIAAICSDDPKEIGDLVAAGKAKPDGTAAHAALVYDIAPDGPLYFAAGMGKLPATAGIDAALDRAQKTYIAKKTAASGDWGDFIEPIINNLNNSKTYSYETKRIAHVVTRGWCAPDGQVLFEWDSFFNGLLSSLDDPQGGRDTVRALLACQQPNGLLPSANNPGSHSIDRSQPPVGAMCVWKMTQRYPDKAFLAECYPKLVKWHDWWFARRPSDGLPYRDGNQNGLLEWGTETGGLQEAKYESGLDDSPMYDDCKMVGPSMNLDDVGLSALWAADAGYLAIIADSLGKPNDARRFREEHKAMSDRINKLMWNEELGVYCNRYWEPMTQYTIVAPEFLSTASGKSGLDAEYCVGADLAASQKTQVDRQVNFFWSEAPVQTPKTDGRFSIRWTGRIKPTAGGPHKFMVTAQDGVKLWIDGKLVIDEWQYRWWRRMETEPIQLQAGREYELKLEHFCGGGECRFYWQGPSIDSRPVIFSPRISPTNFYPLMAGIPDRPRAKRMLDVLTDTNKFWGQYVMPSISRDDPTFPMQHYWRGKIWSPTNYLVYQGLKRYAPDKLRMDFAKKGVDLFMKNWLEHGTCRENFWADGRGGSMPHYTWGSLLCLIGIEEICDIEPDDRVRLNGEWNANLSIDRLPIFGKLYDVRTKNGSAALLIKGKPALEAHGQTATKPLPHSP